MGGPAKQRGTVIRFRLRKGARVELVVRAEDCAVVGRKRIRGRQGLNKVRFDGRVRGRPLRPGTYTITVVAVRAGKRTRVGTVAVEVVPSSRRLTRAQRAAPVAPARCESTGAAFSLPVGLIDASSSFGVDAASTPERLQPPEHRSAFLPPRLPLPFAGGGGGWSISLLALAAYLVLGLAGAAFIVYATRLARGSWPR